MAHRIGAIAATVRYGLAMAVALVGCGKPSQEEQDPSAATPLVIVGTGELEFEAVDETSPAPLMLGPQGGYHMWISMRCAGCGDLVVVKYGVSDAESGELLTYAGLEQQTYLETSGDWREASGLVGYLAPTDTAPQSGRLVTLWASIRASPYEPVIGEGQTTTKIGEVMEWSPIK